MTESTNVQITYGHSPSDRRVAVGGVDISHIVLADGVDVEFAEHGAGVTLRLVPHRLDLSLLDPSIAVHVAECATLTNEEQEDLREAIDADETWRDDCDECDNAISDDHHLFATVGAIIAAREQALREEIAGECRHANVETFRSYPPHSKCLDCGQRVELRWVARGDVR